MEFIDVAGFKRSLSLDTLRSGIKLLHGLKDAYSLLDKLKPDLVIGTGGYVCGPIVFLASLKGIPTCIQEQNAMPGVTNKILARYVRKVFLGYSEAEKYFGGSSKKIFTGNPIRSEIMQKKRKDAVAELGLDANKKTILVSGGSRGARSINNAMQYVERELSGRSDVQVLHATGEVNYEYYMAEMRKAGSLDDNIMIRPYLHNMPVALAAADLAVFRAGAIGLAELTAKGVPAVQEFNAKAVEAAGAAKVILDKELTGEKLLEEIEKLLINDNQLQAMKKAAKSLGRPEAAAEIAQQALNLVRK